MRRVRAVRGSAPVRGSAAVRGASSAPGPSGGDGAHGFSFIRPPPAAPHSAGPRPTSSRPTSSRPTRFRPARFRPARFRPTRFRPASRRRNDRSLSERTSSRSCATSSCPAATSVATSVSQARPAAPEGPDCRWVTTCSCPRPGPAETGGLPRDVGAVRHDEGLQCGRIVRGGQRRLEVVLGVAPAGGRGLRAPRHRLDLDPHRLETVLPQLLHDRRAAGPVGQGQHRLDGRPAPRARRIVVSFRTRSAAQAQSRARSPSVRHRTVTCVS